MGIRTALHLLSLSKANVIEGQPEVSWSKPESQALVHESTLRYSGQMKHLPALCATASLVCGLALSAATARVCDGPREAREATLGSIKDFIDGKQMTVVTFAGYSGAEYEDPEAMLAQASRILDGLDPARTLINIGATEVGIGAVYDLAKRKGFTTLGIVSSLAHDEQVPLSPCVDYVFYVKDTHWGGKIPGTDRLSPTSQALVECSSSFFAIGGGDVARDEMLAARKLGKPVTFIPADLNHRIAREKAQKKGQPEPNDFRGSAHAALAKEN